MGSCLDLEVFQCRGWWFDSRVDEAELNRRDLILNSRGDGRGKGNAIRIWGGVWILLLRRAGVDVEKMPA
jgi:hypothetical protein